MITICPPETGADYDGIGYVHWKAWQEAYAGLIDPVFLAGRTPEKCARQARERAARQLIARESGKVIGFVAYGPYRGEAAAGEVYALYVLREYHGTPTGYRLLAAAMQDLAGYPVVRLWALRGNERALRFYQRYGFRPDGSEKELPELRAGELRLTYRR